MYVGACLVFAQWTTASSPEVRKPQEQVTADSELSCHLEAQSVAPHIVVRSRYVEKECDDSLVIVDCASDVVGHVQELMENDVLSAKACMCRCDEHVRFEPCV